MHFYKGITIIGRFAHEFAVFANSHSPGMGPSM
jgi:hypothetical protein